MYYCINCVRNQTGHLSAGFVPLLSIWSLFILFVPSGLDCIFVSRLVFCIQLVSVCRNVRLGRLVQWNPAISSACVLSPGLFLSKWPVSLLVPRLVPCALVCAPPGALDPCLWHTRCLRSLLVPHMCPGIPAWAAPGAQGSLLVTHLVPCISAGTSLGALDPCWGLTWCSGSLLVPRLVPWDPCLCHIWCSGIPVGASPGALDPCLCHALCPGIPACATPVALGSLLVPRQVP